MTRKWTIWILVLALAMAAVLPAAAQEDEDLEVDEVEEIPREKWYLSGAYIWQNQSYARNAHQTRGDDSSAGPWQYSNGDSDGDGDGFRLSVGRGNEQLVFSYFDSHYRFVNTVTETPTTLRFVGEHTMDTQREEFELAYRRTMDGGLGTSEHGDWGWALGVRRIETDSKIHIFEQARERKVERDVEGGVTWQLLTGGYFGLWRPMGQPYVTFYGSINGLFGEADGLAREDSDDKVDGYISETYRDRDALVYGLNVQAGVVLSYKQLIGVAADYGREWMYSFEATDSGTVVFPDNNDALFIENQHVTRVYAFVSLPL